MKAMCPRCRQYKRDCSCGYAEEFNIEFNEKIKLGEKHPRLDEIENDYQD